MRWQRGRRSEQLEDRRAESGGAGLRLPLPRGRGSRLSLTGLLLVVGVVWLLGGDPLALLGALTAGGGGGGGSIQVPQAGSPGGAPLRSSPQEEELLDFVSFVLDDAQATWAGLVDGYPPAHLVVYRDRYPSACGMGQAAMGPFYCPADQKVYVDLGFYEELRSRFGAPGDFAQAYVLAHELGHHVQKVTGTEARVRRAQADDPGRANDLSVRLELQADCYAGIWAHSTARRDLLEAGDVEEGLNAAAAVGDDRIQRMSGDRVAPERFTHGSSEQRARWFRRGYEDGDPAACDTFAVAQP